MILPSSITPRPLLARQTQSTSTLLLTSTRPGGGGGNILASSVADTNLLWWQLLALIAGGVLAAVVGGWWWYRHRRRQQEDKARKAEVDKAEREGELEKRKKKEEEDEERKRIMRRRGRRRGSWDEESESDWSDHSEDYDSVSDAGTIRPRRRRRRRRRRDRDRRRHRRRRSYSDSEDSYESDESYAPRRRARRERTPSPSPNPPPPIPRVPKDEKKGSGFRDSVFSSYNSMKNAAVKLKYVEAKVKLKKQLEEEERIDAHRKAKIAEANKEIEAARRREQGGDSARSSKRTPRVPLRLDQPLIPPVRRLTSSSGSRTALPTPPPRAARKASYPPPHANKQNLRQARQSSADSYFPPGKTSRTQAGNAELGDEISRLLGAKPRPQQGVQRPLIPPVQRKPSTDNDFQASWLSKPHPSAMPSVPTSPRTTVYLPVTHPKDRPIIPKGKLAPAPKPKGKGELRVPAPKPTLQSRPAGPQQAPQQGWGEWGAAKVDQVSEGVGVSMAGIGVAAVAARKWADRLRERR